MASPAMIVTDEPGKTRIVSHMNKDHQTDLSHILQHFNGLSATDTADARMLDITLDSITVASASGTHVVKLDPPMKWEERRQKLIDITLTARAALGIPTDPSDNHGPSPSMSTSPAPVLMRNFHAPRGADWVVFGAVAFFFTSYGLVSTGQVEPGTVAWKAIEAVRFPGGAPMFKWLVKAIFWPTIAIHVTELVVMERTRLAKHGIQRGSGVWLLWLATTFFEGVMAFKRFDGAVAEAKKKSS